MLVQASQVAFEAIKASEVLPKSPTRTPILRQPLMKSGDQAKHSDVSKFFKGRGQKPHSAYRRMMKERRKPEDIR